MPDRFYQHLTEQLADIRDAGLYKVERVITTPQRAHIATTGRDDVLNMCANNYLGLADYPEVIAAARAALDDHGYGMASVRFICGTQDAHKELETRVSGFLGTDDTILYTSCFDANGGLFETLLTADDAIISDALNHASIIDGVRLCKAKRFRYANSDMADLEAKLKEADAAGARFKMIATDGVFSMDGYIAKLPDICALADQYDALVMVDDSHATGFMGDTGRGTPEYHGVADRIDVVTSTLGKALGGASGGFTSARQPIIDLLRQRSRPYLFSNTLAPPIVAGSIKAIELVQRSTELRDKLHANTAHFVAGAAERGLDMLPGAGEHPIVPIMVGDAALATRMADAMLERGVYVIGFSFPVVPKGQARIRVQVSAAHSIDDLNFALDAFAAVRDELR